LILAVSLYAPHVAKLLAYADCSIQQLAHDDPRLCDCNQIVTADAVPLFPDQPDKQKEISIKADWKYETVVSYRFSDSDISIKQIFSSIRPSFIPEQFSRSVFHPPQC
jgi:hypothetical protein